MALVSLFPKKEIGFGPSHCPALTCHRLPSPGSLAAGYLLTLWPRILLIMRNPVATAYRCWQRQSNGEKKQGFWRQAKGWAPCPSFDSYILKMNYEYSRSPSKVRVGVTQWQTSPKQEELAHGHINSSLRLQAVYFRLTSPHRYPTPGRTCVIYRWNVWAREQLSGFKSSPVLMGI